MEPTTPAAVPATPVETTPAPSTPNPITPDAPANPGTGTGQATEPALRNQPNVEPSPTPTVPEGYVPTDKFNASRDEALRLNDLVKSLGYDPKNGQKLEPTTVQEPTAPAQTPTAPLSYEQAVATVPGFSTLSEAEKALVLNPRQAYKDISEMRRMVAEMYDERETTKQIKELVSKEDYKDLDQEAFREFIYRDDNLGVTNLETLAKMFKAEAPTPATPAPKPEGAEPTSGGAKEIAPGVGKVEMTSADAAALRTRDPKQYGALIRAKRLVIIDN